MVSFDIIETYSLPRNHIPFFPKIFLHLIQPYLLKKTSFASSPEMCYIFYNFGVATGGLAVVGRRGQSTATLKTSSFQTHSFHFAFFRFGKLGCYHDKAEVDHEK